MAHYSLVNQRTGMIVATHVEAADTMWTRLKGLLGRRALPEGYGMRIRPSGSVHMMFMRFSIDVVYVDKHDRVVKTVRSLAPWRVSAARGARAVFELSEGTLDRYDVQPGDPMATQRVSDGAAAAVPPA
jgi:uncharacterized membrane protein (UPF0127 family)